MWDKLKKVSDIKINEAFILPTEDEIIKNIKDVDFMPNNLDVSIPSWLKRLEYWGKLNIIHNNPEFSIKNKLF